MSNEYPWWKTAVIYQIYPRSFQDTTGNGIGDLPGIISRLPYLSDTLGIDAIWLSPFYPSPMKDFGYDVADYRGVDPLFGTRDDFDRLLKEAHSRKLRIIIDLVPNHTSDQHPWFLESRSSRDNPKRDWYVWRDAGIDGSPPNNWLSVFGGLAWEWDENTSQYYLHSFLKEQPDLNWRNPEVKEAVFDVVRFWLERGVDGFRIDVAHFIMKDPQMRNNPLNENKTLSLHRSLGEYDSQIHLYDKGHPDVHGVYREFRSLLDRYSQENPRVSLGEIHIFDLKEWSSYYGRDLDEIHLPLNFTLLKAAWDAEHIRQQVDSLEIALPKGAWPNYVLGNHDEARLASRIGRKQARIAAMLLLTLRGTPTLYYGDEIGMKNGEIPSDRELDPAGLNQPGQEQGRDICRTPMQWSPQEWAAFSPQGTGDTWLPLQSDYQQTNVESQLADPASMIQLYISLLRIRRSNPALQIGTYQALLEDHPSCFCYLRETPEQKLLICLNFSAEEQSLEFPLREKGYVMLSTHLDREGKAEFPLRLRPNEGCLIKV
jgi:alpha-glucosidase